MIKTKKLVKAFGSRVVLRSLDLSIESGEFVVLLGRNGAGKSTLMNIIATLSKPTAGEITISGQNLSNYATHIRRYIGLVSHKTLLYDDLSGEQNLRFYARMYDVDNPQERIATVLQQVGLWGRQKDPVRTYSRGMQQRLAIARSILHNPPLLLLDEPDTGLDQQATTMLADLLAAVGTAQRTVLMTTHNLERGIALGSRVLVLHNGKITYDKPKNEVDVAHIQSIYFTNKN